MDGAYLALESVKVVANGHGESEQLFERLLRLLKGDGNAARFKGYPRGEIFEFLGQNLKRSFDKKLWAFKAILFQLGQDLGDVPPAPPFIVTHIALSKAAQMGDEGIPIGQPASPYPFGNAVSHDLLRPAAADAEQKFEGGPIHERAGKGMELADNIIDFAVPDGFGGHGVLHYVSARPRKIQDLVKDR